MAVVGHPTALFFISFSGKGRDNGLGASSGPMFYPLDSLDLLCTHLASTFVLSKIILVIASPSSVSIASVDIVTGRVFFTLLMTFIISSYLISPSLSHWMQVCLIFFTSISHNIQITSRWIVYGVLLTILLSSFS